MTSEKLTELLNGAFAFGERLGQTADISWREGFAAYVLDNVARLSREPHPDTLALDEIREAAPNIRIMINDAVGASPEDIESIVEAKRMLTNLLAVITPPRGGLCPGCADDKCLGSARPELCSIRAQDAGREP